MTLRTLFKITKNNQDLITHHNSARCHNIKLPRTIDQHKLACYARDVFTSLECQILIRWTEQLGYIPALLNLGQERGEKLRTDYRNSGRCIVDVETKLLNQFWERLEPLIPSPFTGHRVIGINEHFRFLKYTVGQYFKVHKDGSFTRNIKGQKQTSLITIQLYLNDDYTGGDTTFVDPSNTNTDTIFTPSTGSVLIFQHDIFHKGSKVTEGTKYTMRTDVMFTVNNPSTVQ